MPRIPWSKITKVIVEKYVEDNKCKLCGEEIERGESKLRFFANVYRHFKEKHPDKIDEARASLVA